MNTMVIAILLCLLAGQTYYIQRNKKRKGKNDKPWGFEREIYKFGMYNFKILHVFPQQRTSLQYHEHRSETMKVLKGEGTITVEHEIAKVAQGSVVEIKRKNLHRIHNTSKTKTLIIFETQFGDYFNFDTKRVEDDYERRVHAARY